MSDTRNIDQRYKDAGWSTEEIKQDLAATAYPFSLVLTNLTGDFNVSSAMRNANWFNLREIFLVGKRHFDSRGAVGAHHYMNLIKRPDIHELVGELKARGTTVVAAEIDERAVALTEFAWPSDVAVLFGEELSGLPRDVLDACDHVVAIPGRGSVRSLNVATTTGIFMYDYMTKNGA